MAAAEEKNMGMARRIAERVAAAGGRTFFVGGIVRDRLLGRENKDVDIEVHGVTPRRLEEILEQLGEVIQTGVSFGVFGLRSYDIDIAMPRKEKAVGRGHRDFAVFVDPFIGCERAALRRDFTINAMMEDVLTGEVLDFFGGRADLASGLIRHVSDATFQEDALRVLRAAQFAARFQFRIAEETAELSRGMPLEELAPERVLGELSKALLKADKPGIFFAEMRRMGQLSCWFPEAEALIGVPQSPVHHPEGDVWTHTMMVLDAAARFRDAAVYPLGFMLAALAHDFGKAVSTVIADGRIRAIGHEQTGVRIAKRFLGRISSAARLRTYVLNMVGLHMEPNMMAEAGSGVKATTRMFDRAVCPEDLLLLARADRLGRGGAEPDGETEAFLQARYARYRELMALPFVRGRDLIEAGIRPGADFHEALGHAHKLRLAGVPKQEALAQTIAYIRKTRGET